MRVLIRLVALPRLITRSSNVRTTQAGGRVVGSHGEQQHGQPPADDEEVEPQPPADDDEVVRLSDGPGGHAGPAWAGSRARSRLELVHRAEGLHPPSRHPGLPSR